MCVRIIIRMCIRGMVLIVRVWCWRMSFRRRFVVIMTSMIWIRGILSRGLLMRCMRRLGGSLLSGVILRGWCGMR
ncbi:hypothetical protein BU204_37775 [Actinophytocola xanthii]|uniref:Uncharacterized protein n=1 Tax=Actinophytocola xanthii TaxID=1912961 RepID=A0A1Q8BQH2_9PSEU|nr:hypothetical protein BU204_37775 [Actinophytocola xanthii]